MKKGFLIVILLLALSLCCAAGADPVLTDGKVTAWIGEDNTLFYVDEANTLRRLNLPVTDLLSIDGQALYLLDQSGQLIAVQRDGTSGSVLSAQPAEADIQARRENRFTLQDGVLTAGAVQQSGAAACAASDGTYLYWAEKTGDQWLLRQASLTAPAPADAQKLLDGIAIPEPLSLCATTEDVTLTAADHSVHCYSVANGQGIDYDPSGNATAAAALVKGTLNRYESTGSGWQAEGSGDSILIPLHTVEPTATPTPTPTPRPTETPTPSPSPTPDPATVTLRPGDRGTLVRQVQRRLSNLGYPVGYVDGVYGTNTQIAIELFMDAIGVTERNYITPSVRRSLMASGAPEYDPYMALTEGSRGRTVTYMQERLQELGYDPEKIDGSYGQLTIAAVALFQKDAGLEDEYFVTPGDYASRKTLKRLYSDDAPTRRVIKGGGIYKLGDKSASLIGVQSRGVKSLKIYPTVDANGKEYPVTSVAAGACKNLRSLSSLTIGSNVKKIGDNAFSGCSRMQTISVKTSLLTDEKMGSDVFTGIPETVTVTCPEDLVKTYKKLFRSRGLPKGASFEPQ